MKHKLTILFLCSLIAVAPLTLIECTFFYAPTDVPAWEGYFGFALWTTLLLVAKSFYVKQLPHEE
jgi:hypothetical protein